MGMERLRFDEGKKASWQMISKHLLNQRYIPSSLKEAKHSFIQRQARAEAHRKSTVTKRSDDDFLKSLFETRRREKLTFTEAPLKY